MKKIRTETRHRRQKKKGERKIINCLDVHRERKRREWKENIRKKEKE